MRPTKWFGALAAAATLCGLTAVAAPVGVAGAAKATKLWVSNSAPTVAGPGKNCSKPGYSTVQSALEVAGNFGAVIEVCSGTYAEQLSITGNVTLNASGGPVTLKLPAAPAPQTTTCDTANGSAVGESNFSEVSICGAQVAMNGITVSAFYPAGDCYDSLYGIFVGQGSQLTTDNLTVSGAGVPLGDSAVGCQGGQAVQVGSYRGSGQTAAASLKNTTISGYQKGGIVAAGTGTTLDVKTATVTGRGPVGTAQNGIEVLSGAKATITGATVSGNNCDPNLIAACGPNGLNDTQAAGILFYQAASGSVVKKSSFNGNDLGLYYLSGSATEPASSELSVTKSTFTGNLDEAICLDAGVASFVKDTVDGTGNVGVQVLQYAGQPYAPAETAKGLTITGQGIGVQVLSDNAPSDVPGTFSISRSSFLSGNTTGTNDNSTTYTISGGGNH